MNHSVVWRQLFPGCVECVRKTNKQKFLRLCISMAKTWSGAKIPRPVMKKICLHMPRGTFQGLWRTSQSKKAIICGSKMPVVVLGGWREVSLGMSEHMPFEVCFTGFSQSRSELLIITEFSRFSTVWANTRPPSMSQLKVNFRISAYGCSIWVHASFA